MNTKKKVLFKQKFQVKSQIPKSPIIFKIFYVILNLENLRAETFCVDSVSPTVNNSDFKSLEVRLKPQNQNIDNK